MMELSSGILTSSQLWSEVEWLIGLLKQESIEEIIVMFGFGCDTSNQWIDIPIQVSMLRSFLTENIESGVFKLGCNDLYILCLKLDLEFQLANDEDIHVKCDQQRIVDTIKLHWLKEGYRGYEKIDENWRLLL